MLETEQKDRRGGARPNTGGARPGAGRKPKAIRESLPKLLDKCFTEADREAVFSSLTEKAKQGDFQSTQLLLAYTFGKPTEHHEIGGNGDKGEIVIKVVYANADADPSTTT